MNFVLSNLNLPANYPANTGKPIVAVLIKAPAKIMKGSNGYFSSMRFRALYSL